MMIGLTVLIIVILLAVIWILLKLLGLAIKIPFKIVGMIFKQPFATILGGAGRFVAIWPSCRNVLPRKNN